MRTTPRDSPTRPAISDHWHPNTLSAPGVQALDAQDDVARGDDEKPWRVSQVDLVISRDRARDRPRLLNARNNRLVAREVADDGEDGIG